MKKTFHALTLSALFLMVAISSHAEEKKYEDIRKHKSCKLCGMSREDVFLFEGSIGLQQRHFYRHLQHTLRGAGPGA